MQVFQFHRHQLKRFNDQHLNLVYNQDVYSEYIHRDFSLQHFNQQAEEKKTNFLGREVLVDSLNNQYQGIDELGLVGENIASLADENTFTVTTGHQLSLFTGPLYFVVKIMHVIKLSELLSERYPDKKFVPVYWMASEDHDFEEIRKINLFGRELEWESNQTGAVGRFDISGMDEMKLAVKDFFKNNAEAEIHQLLDNYSGNNLAMATRSMVHELFKAYGLVVVDGDDAELKKTFAPVIKKELTEKFSFEAVKKTSESLKKDGGKIQVNPREVNLFYLKDNIRSRIIEEGGIFSVDGVGSFSSEELLEEVNAHPERFSPNVILRPLYQEMILPNLAYIGGVGEMSYWLQIKGVFDAVGCLYPLIGVRNSLMWIDRGISKKMEKIALHIEDAFKSVDDLKRQYVSEHSGDELDFRTLDANTEQLTSLLKEMMITIDAGKEQFIAGETTRLEKQIDGLKQKMVKIAKSNHESAMKQIDSIKDKLFPGNGLQERSANFFSFCPDGNYSDRLQWLHEALDPEQNDFFVIRES